MQSEAVPDGQTVDRSPLTARMREREYANQATVRDLRTTQFVPYMILKVPNNE